MMAERRNYIRDGRAPIPEKEITSRIMSAIRNKDTKPELILRKALWSNGIRGYRLHWKKVPGRPDISFPGRKVAIFVNGCFWHRCPNCQPAMPKSHSEFWSKKFEKNIERDSLKLNLLSSEGWKTMVIWECQIKNNVSNFIKKVKSLLHS